MTDDRLERLEFQIGDFVLYLLDGDIGVVTDVDPMLTGDGCDEPYHVEWYVDGDSSGWHSAFHTTTGERVMTLLGGRQ